MRFLGVLSILLACLQAPANIASTTGHEYNALYNQILIEKTQWPQALQQKKMAYDTASAAFSDQGTTLAALEQMVTRTTETLVTQQQHLAFLQQVEKRALEEKQKVRQRVANSGEFSSAGDVNPGSISRKVSEHEGAITVKQDGVDQNLAKIESLKATAEYQGYLQRRRSLKRQQSNKNGELNQIESSISNTEFNISQLNAELGRSEDRQQDAEIRSIRIRQQRIPNLRREIQNIRNDIQNKKSNVQNKVQTRRDVENRRDQTKSKLGQKQQQLNQPGADTASIQAEIRQLEDRIRQQDRRISNLTNDIRSMRRDIEQLKNRREDHKREISRLENRLNRLNDIISEESIKQVQLDREIRSSERELSSLESDKGSVLDELSRLRRQISSVQSQINSYVKTNINPIKAVIDGLEKEQRILRNRIKALQTALVDLQTEDQNILIAEQKIPEQQIKITTIQQSLAKKTADLEAANQSAAPLKARLEETKLDFNNLVLDIQNKKQKLKDLEGQIVEAIQTQLQGGNTNE